MIINELHNLSATELLQGMQAGQYTSVDLVNAVFKRIDAVEGRVQGYLLLLKTQALEQATVIDLKRINGQPLGPLAGIPIAIKDNINIQGLPTTCASKILEGYQATYNADVIERLKVADAVIIGKTNMDEFAMGSSTENSAFKKTYNPWNLTCVPGGSSGGSAAVVSSGETILALGSDTGGSIRQPAAFCGVVGLKPTYGRVSRYGLVAFASSLDQIGPFARTVSDTALLLNVISGHDRRDSTSSEIKVPDFTSGLTKEIKGLKIAIPKELIETEGIDPNVLRTFNQAVENYKALGATVEFVSLSSFDYSVATYYIIAPAEASSNLARFDGVRYGLRVDQAKTLHEMIRRSRSAGFGPEVKRRILMGTFVLSSGYYDAYYRKAQQVRTLITQDFNRTFEKYDVIISPTSPTPPFRIGEKSNDPLSMYLADIATIPVNMAGLPAISIPCGMADGLPVGLQIIGKAWDEQRILQTAFAYEQNFGLEPAHPIL